GVDTRYYNQLNPNGVPIDGTNANNAGEIDQLPVTGQPAFFNTCVPTQDICTVIDNPEEVAGPNGAMVFASDILPSHLVSNVHYFFTADSDNDFTGIPLDELDAEVWVYPVPLAQPENLISATTSATGRDYGLNVQAPLQTAVTPFNGPAAATPETPLAALLPVAAAFAVLIGRRRRSRPA